MPLLIAASPAPRPPERSTGSCPTPLKNAAVSLPLTPGVVKYSAFAMKVTRRSRTAGRKKESEKERWLLARIAGPSSGMFSMPSTHGRNATLSEAPRECFIAL
ncbi:hypothetical protein GA0115246_111337 [Streptomyces sp. SolWspMP-sol7th]|nr:hypothetical protein GA0115246_111337 [Streptomyces sp. SolWspMP-sol7th]